MSTKHLAFRFVLFDFDGTLADSYAAITASVNHVRAIHQLPPLTERDVRPYVGYGPNHLLESTIPRGSVTENMAAYRAHHPSVLRTGTRLLPGVAEVLRKLQELGIQLGVCSNKPVEFTRQLLIDLEIASRFEVVLGPEDVERPKPAPDMLLEALQRLGARASDTLYVGDMVVDIHTARAAGVMVWVVPTGSDKPESLAAAHPDRILGSMDELVAAIVR